MAFDYGSIDLGLKNPFKPEGRVTAFRGVLQLLAGIYLLFTAVKIVKTDAGAGWILVVFGIFVLSLGIRALGSGIYATLRYFVGRNHPTSLARNFNKSDATKSDQESNYVAYTAQVVEEMLVGRKNATFLEPQGFLARLLHSLFPKLLFMPYPIRNLTQRIFGAWVKMLTALIAFGFVAFVSLAGFAGEAGKTIFPAYALVLVIYLIFVWYAGGRGISRGAEKSIDSFGSRDLVKVLSMAIVLPGVVGMGFSWVMTQNRLSAEQVATWMEALSRAHVFWYLAGIFAAALISTGLLAFLLRARMTKADPVTEVSELRENWQESVHPNEIFINLDNLVMANRRYKEVPNRVYKELDPQLNEQVEGKGDFRGEMIQEVQPRVMPMAWRPGFLRARLTSLLAGNLCHLASLALTLLLAFALVRVYQHTGGQANAFGDVFSGRGEDLMTLGANAAHLFVIMVIFNGFANLLVNTAHLFYAEIQFESLLIYFKCEGTFTESKISTGTGIHDSTRSENTLIRSSITPWVIVSRIVSTTFAATGMRNLEHPRYILEMRKSDKDLRSIKEDMIDFLKDRESIASITSVRDLGNASQIYQLNQQTRPGGTPPKEIEKEAETAGYLRQEKDLTPQDSE